jgi:hypothetical protein
MVATAAHLTDHVVPRLPVRQWVLAVPKRLRYFLHRDAELQGAAVRMFLHAVEPCLRVHSPGMLVSTTVCTSATPPKLARQWASRSASAP